MRPAQKAFLYKKLDNMYSKELMFLDQDLDECTITYQEYDRWVVSLNKRYLNFKCWIKNNCKGEVK